MPNRLWIPLFFGLLLAFGSIPVFARDEVPAEEAFIRFQKEWLDGLNRHGKFGESHMRVEREPDHGGAYVARYSELTGPTAYEIKKTGQSKVPYIGVLHYEERSYLSKGKTPEEAGAGPFQCEKQTAITEIFRFSDGKWVY